ncbi:hypothetical protein ACSBR1_035366 [Camellia fascicularis]
MAEEVKLFGVCGSPFSCRVEIGLKLEDIHNESPLLLSYNPIHKKIPVLFHNENPLLSLFSLLSTLMRPEKVVPSCLQILMREPWHFWARFIDEKCLPAIWKVCSSKDKEQEKDMEEAR